MEDRRALEQLPLPLARAYRRLLNAREPRERHDAAYYLFEIYLKYAASIAIAAYLSGEERDHQVNQALKGLVRPSLGQWLLFLRSCLKFFRSKSERPVVVLALDQLLFSKDIAWPERVVGLYNELRSFLAGEPCCKDRVTLETILNEVVAYRNRVLGHGALLDARHYERFAQLFAGAFEDVAAGSTLLSVLRLVSFDVLKVQGDRVECGVVEHMGLEPMRRSKAHSVPYGQALPRQGAIYLLGEGVTLLLNPLVIAHDEDVYFLNEASGRPEYISYSSGEQHFSGEIQSAQEGLFERILGYAVDEQKLTNLGGDLAPPPALSGSEEQTGRRLGDYTIVREIGSGGMGTVFEAVQTSLGRRVALKVLPGSFALDAKRVERFRREARATARIHHPSIVPVYDVGESEGTHFYAMEFIEGRSLADHLHQARNAAVENSRRKTRESSTSDPSYIASVVQAVASVAEGLDLAHKQGLVHRDVKPSNLLVDGTGRYVLIDFGLVHDTEAKTLTASGELLGTLSYMSPEQVSRSEIDARSDVYSLSATLYEALTLRSPFERASDHETQRAILFEDPVPPRKLNPKLHRDVETVIMHALERNPGRRYRSCGELAADLRRFLRYEPIAARPQSSFMRLVRRTWRHRAKVAVSVLGALAVLLGFLLWAHWPEKKLSLRDYRQLTVDAGLTIGGSLSKDGTQIVYASDRGGKGGLNIWTQPVSGGVAKQVTFDDADETDPALSPDGKEIAYRSEREGGSICVAPVEGGLPRKLVERGRNPRYSPDGTMIAYWVGAVGGSETDGSVLVIACAGGAPRKVAEDLVAAQGPAWAPRGDRLLCKGVLRLPSGREESDWFVVSLDGEPSRRTGLFAELARLDVPVFDSSGRYIHPAMWDSAHDLVFFSAIFRSTENLWAVKIAADTGELRGRPQRLTAGTAREMSPWCGADGKVIFSSLQANVDIWGFDAVGNSGLAEGELQRLTSNPSLEGQPSLSMDGSRLVYYSTHRGNRDVMLLDLQKRDEPKELTGGLQWAYRPTLTNDGSRIAFQGSRGVGSDIYVLDLDAEGNGSPRQLPSQGVWHPRGWTSDNRFVICSRDGKSGNAAAVLVDADTGEVHPLAERHDANVWQARFSPDDQWVACNVTYLTTRQSAILIFPCRHGQTPAPDSWIQITEDTTWEDKPRWSPDGNIIYFTSDRDGCRCIWARRLDPETKHPVGKSFEVRHFGQARHSMLHMPQNPLEISVSRNRIALSLEERSGNIWIAEIGEHR